MLTYKKAGVDVKKADGLINNLKDKIQGTFNPFVLNPIGGFGSMTEIPTGYKDPILVTSTDGVGTKLRIAFQSQKHNTVGIDLVAMSVNDVLTLGAQPFFFLDYYACGSIQEEIYKEVISGICEGCSQAGCALIGGETAEMPSFYKENEYDLAGFVVGFVDRGKIIDGTTISEGDVIIALPSSGLHSNGYSLVRKVFFESQNYTIYDRVEGIDGMLYEELLKPTKIYIKSVHSVLRSFSVKGMAHITGGGLPGNIKRIIPDGLTADIHIFDSKIPRIFKRIMEIGEIGFSEMCSTFNMGIGFVLVVSEADADAIVKQFLDEGERAYAVGSIVRSPEDEKVRIELG
jgi:phosphoribosylformylglycinamidine cyclo-ligase